MYDLELLGHLNYGGSPTSMTPISFSLYINHTMGILPTINKTHEHYKLYFTSKFVLLKDIHGSTVMK
jgi:hypothetical protein